MRSYLYDAMAAQFGIGKVNLLASFALFDDDPSRINRLENEFKKNYACYYQTNGTEIFKS